jgi:hypothetical protein
MNQNHLSEQFQLANNQEDILVSCSWARFFDNDIQNYFWIKSQLRKLFFFC